MTSRKSTAPCGARYSVRGGGETTDEEYPRIAIYNKTNGRTPKSYRWCRPHNNY